LIASLEEVDGETLDRAAMAALPFIRKIDEVEGEQHVIFVLDDVEYAVHIDSILEIGEPLITTPVPNVSDWVLGVANLRGDIVSVIDLRAFMGLPLAGPAQEKRMLVAQSGGGEISACFVVDQVLGIRYLDMDQLSEDTIAATEYLQQFLSGACEHQGEKYVVLDFNRLLSSERMQAL
jgi:chemotaxis signal transduction protein